MPRSGHRCHGRRRQPRTGGGDPNLASIKSRPDSSTLACTCIWVTEGQERRQSPDSVRTASTQRPERAIPCRILNQIDFPTGEKGTLHTSIWQYYVCRGMLSRKCQPSQTLLQEPGQAKPSQAKPGQARARPARPNGNIRKDKKNKKKGSNGIVSDETSSASETTIRIVAQATCTEEFLSAAISVTTHPTPRRPNRQCLVK